MDYMELDNKKVEQFIHNINVLEELAKSNPNIDILKTYKGFGGLKRCFYRKDLYAKLMPQIRANFGRQQQDVILANLKQSASSAYYTPKAVIKFIYRYLMEVCGFSGGEILEPACGHGAFFEYMPAEIRNNSTITGIEYDILTSKLVKTIYNDVEVVNDGLQNVDFEAKKYDLVIGNPPYSYEVINHDKQHNDITGYTIHHYFTAKCVRLLKNNGILAFILPSFWMDIPRRNTRHIVDNEAVVIDVIRLPENLFTQATVTVDILLVRKSGNRLHDITQVVELKQDNKKDNVNSYWLNNPKRVLGTLGLKWVNAYNRYVPNCVADDVDAVLRYIEGCSFDAATKDNYQKIVADVAVSANVQVNVDSKVSLTNELAVILSEVCELQQQHKAISNRLVALCNKLQDLPCPDC